MSKRGEIERNEVSEGAGGGRERDRNPAGASAPARTWRGSNKTGEMKRLGE